MGLSPSKPEHSIVVERLPAERDGESEVIRSITSKDGLVDSIGGVTTLYENFKRAAKEYGDRPCFGWRENEGPYKWLTYKEAQQRFLNFGSGLVHIGMKPKDFVGIYSINRVEWCLTEQAANAYSMVVVPLYDTLGGDACEYIVNQTELSLIVCTPDKLKLISNFIEKTPTLKTVIFMGEADEGVKKELEEKGISLYSFEQVEKLGSENTKEVVPPKPEDLATICYTSGTTGNPKGAMLTHRNHIACAAGGAKRSLDLRTSDIHISYLPLAHMFERVVNIALIYFGSSMGFYRGDILKLMDDIATLKPTIFCSVPRLLNRVYDKVMENVNKEGGIKKTLFETAYNAKLQNLKYDQLTHAVWDPIVFKKVAARLGGRVRLVVTGSAPISPDVLNFLRICFSCPVLEGYGQTECAAAATITNPFESTVGHVGTPLSCNDVKLVDVPDMNYLSTDKPYPRGEVCFKGPNVFTGYYKNDEKTKEALDEHGWLHSGDIGLIDESGNLKIIDRKKNIFKLAQGEYVAPEKIENIFAKSRFVAQSFVHGDSLQSCLVAVVVPDFEILKPWAKEQGFENADNAEELCKNPEVKKTIMEDMNKVGKEAKLKGFELVKNIHLHPELFSVENDILTPTFKLKRPQAQKYFREQIDEMYKALN